MDAEQSEKFLSNMRNFLRLCQAELGLKQMPKIIWVHGNHGVHAKTFGQYNPKDQTIRVSIRDRHPLDIMRTLAHELVHYLQATEGRLKPGSGKTGSPEENEAHSRAGIIMRHFDRAFPDAFALSSLSENTSKIGKRIDGKTLNTIYNIQSYDRDLKKLRKEKEDEKREKDNAKSRERYRELKAAGIEPESVVRVYLLNIPAAAVRHWRATKDREWALDSAKGWGKVKKTWLPEVLRDLYSNPEWQATVIKIWELADLVLKTREMPRPNQGGIASGTAALGRVGSDPQEAKDAYSDLIRIINATLRKHNTDRDGLRLPPRK